MGRNCTSGWRDALARAARLRDRSPRGVAASALLAVAALSWLVGLSNVDLTSPDEARYAQVAEEIRAFGHGAAGLVLLHLNGEVYDQKPPLWFWLTALAGVPTGRVSEWSARLPSALAALATVLLAMRLGTSLLGRCSGLVAGALLVTAVEFAVLARRASLDALLTCFTTLALTAFWRWDLGSGRRRTDLAWMHAAMGLAVLTKGPVGLLLPILAATAYLGWERRLRDLPKLFPPWALLLSIAPGLAWLALAAALAPDGFLSTAVGDNLFARFFLGKHAQPFHFYLSKFPQQFLPWTLVWPLVWWVGRTRVFSSGPDPGVTRAWRFLLAWVASTLLFFSLSSGKRGLYLLPAYPAAALLCADALVRCLRDRSALPAWLIAGLGAAIVLVAATAAGVLLLDPDWACASLRPFAGAVLACGAIAGSALWLHSRARLALAPSLAMLWLCLAGVRASVFVLLDPAIAVRDSARRLAEQAAELAPPEQPIGLFRERSLLGGLVYYSGRRLVALPSKTAIREFLAQGSSLLVVEREDMAELGEVALLTVEAQVELGDQIFVVAQARAPRSHSSRNGLSPPSRSRCFRTLPAALRGRSSLRNSQCAGTL